MIYLHDSPVRFHGALNTSNCLVDSRWVVKVADFGLREFKRGAEDLSLKESSKIREKCYSEYSNVKSKPVSGLIIFNLKSYTHLLI